MKTTDPKTEFDRLYSLDIAFSILITCFYVIVYMLLVQLFGLPYRPISVLFLLLVVMIVGYYDVFSDQKAFCIKKYGYARERVSIKLWLPHAMDISRGFFRLIEFYHNFNSFFFDTLQADTIVLRVSHVFWHYHRMALIVYR